MKTVKRSDLEKLVSAVIRLFEAQNEEHPGKRTVAARERAVFHYLKKITSSAEERRNIRDAVEFCVWINRTTDETLEKQLREVGYEIMQERGK